MMRGKGQRATKIAVSICFNLCFGVRFERLFNIFALVFGMIFFSSLISSLSATMAACFEAMPGYAGPLCGTDSDGFDVTRWAKVNFRMKSTQTANQNLCSNPQVGSINGFTVLKAPHLFLRSKCLQVSRYTSDLCVSSHHSGQTPPIVICTIPWEMN